VLEVALAGGEADGLVDRLKSITGQALDRQGQVGQNTGSPSPQ